MLVDDDRSLSVVLSTALSEEGFEVTLASDGAEGFRLFQSSSPDLVLLDVLMPQMDGLEVCRRIRKTSTVPIIFLTSRSEEVDRINGLELGADDYVTKPFSTRELCARIRSIGRRLERQDPEEARGKRLSVGPLTIDVSRFEVRWNGQQVVLTRAEFELLRSLVSRRGRVLGREQLLELARDDDAVVTDRTIDTLVKRVRKKLKAVDASFDEIETVIGVGYRYRDGA